MKHMTQVRRGAAAIAAAALSVACSAQAETTEQPQPAVVWALLDADSHGAVVIGTPTGEGSPRLFGVNRDGVVMWQADSLADRLPTVVCAARCPAAIASSGMASANELKIADEPPVALGEQARVDFALGHKTSVLSSGPSGLVQEMVDTAGNAQLRIPDAVPITGWGTRWRTSNDGSVAVALTDVADEQRVDVRVFVAEPGRWRSVGEVRRSNSMFGCASANGRHVIVSDPTPTLVSTAARTPIAGLEAGGDCGFVADGAVIAEYAVTGSQRRTRIVTVDLDGKVRQQQDYPFEARIATDLDGRGHLVILQGHAEERDLSGAATQKLDDVADARYVETGEIASVSEEGAVRWTAGGLR
jgi:hypothetical protein